MLYIISTPIGNLEDITLRAIKVINMCDYVLCEDTKVSIKLLNHYDIKKKLISFHKFSEKQKKEQIITALENGKDIALISDAGTPLVSDPGLDLIQECIEKNIQYTAVPGASSVISAFCLSGFDTPFQFVGFLSKKDGELKNTIKKFLYFEGTSICFESARRLVKTLKIIKELDPNRKVCVVREMTKMFEEKKVMNVSGMIKYYEKHPPKGEIVLLLEKSRVEEDLSTQELIEMLQKLHGLSLKEAIKIAANLKNIPKRDIYKIAHQI